MRPGPPAGYGDRLSISMSPRMEAPAINSQPTTDAYTLRRSSYGAQAYEAFGNPTGQAGTTVNPFRYVGALGYYSDRTSGLRLLGARYYGPSPRRFWTRDPTRGAASQYAYVGNSPVVGVDPEGLWCVKIPVVGWCVGTTCDKRTDCPQYRPPRPPHPPAPPRPVCPPRPPDTDACRRAYGTPASQRDQAWINWCGQCCDELGSEYHMGQVWERNCLLGCQAGNPPPIPTPGGGHGPGWPRPR
jgi:RHS repeat-associated protein